MCISAFLPFFAPEDVRFPPVPVPTSAFSDPGTAVHEKYFRFFGSGLQRVVKIIRKKVKKYFAGMKNGCIFAAVFDRKTTVHRNG
jgi:hypothetical protein